MLGFRISALAQRAHGLAAVGQNDQLLVGPVAQPTQRLEHAPARPLVMRPHEREAAAGACRSDLRPRDDRTSGPRGHARNRRRYRPLPGRAAAPSRTGRAGNRQSIRRGVIEEPLIADRRVDGDEICGVAGRQSRRINDFHTHGFIEVKAPALRVGTELAEHCWTRSAWPIAEGFSLL